MDHGKLELGGGICHRYVCLPLVSTIGLPATALPTIRRVIPLDLIGPPLPLPTCCECGDITPVPCTTDAAKILNQMLSW